MCSVLYQQTGLIKHISCLVSSFVDFVKYLFLAEEGTVIVFTPDQSDEDIEAIFQEEESEEESQED